MMRVIQDFPNKERAIHNTLNEDIKYIKGKEQETIININRNEEYAYIDTSDQTILTKLCKLNSFIVDVYCTNKGKEEIYQLKGRILKRLLTWRNLS